MSRVYAIASGKGGVGKTSTTANVAAALAAAGQEVVVVDADIGMPNLGATLGVSPDGTTVHDVLAGRADPEDAVYEGPHGLGVVPGDDSLDAFRDADPGEIGVVLDAFEEVDYVFVDTAAGVSHESALPLSLADDVVLVSTNERDALGDTEKTRQLAERLGGGVAGIVVTRVPPDANPQDASPVEAKVLGSVPEDSKVAEAAAEGVPLTEYAPDSPPATAYMELASTLTGESVRAPFGGGDAEENPLSDNEADVDGEKKGFLSRLFG